MNLTKILIGGIVGGIVYFLLGWLLYGEVLMDYYTANTNQCMMKPMADMNWLAMIVSNLAMGFLIAMIMSWSNTTDIMSGAKIAAITGFLFCLSLDMSFYSMSTMYSNSTVMVVDIVIGTLMTAIGGAIVAWVMGIRVIANNSGNQSNVESKGIQINNLQLGLIAVIIGIALTIISQTIHFTKTIDYNTGIGVVRDVVENTTLKNASLISGVVLIVVGGISLVMSINKKGQ